VVLCIVESRGLESGREGLEGSRWMDIQGREESVRSSRGCPCLAVLANANEVIAVAGPCER
jgi:hypothetical protein